MRRHMLLIPYFLSFPTFIMPLLPNNDVLWLISKINASDNAFSKQHRLTTTRIMSQVCQRWREVVLGSPLIWGRLILLDENQSTEWTEEVLKRAGSSSQLWIELKTNRNTSPKEHGRLLSCLFGILQNWERIEVLHILTHNNVAQENSPYRNIWEHMTKPAPILRSFRISHQDFSFRHPLALPNTLFESHAPLLRRLSCFGICIAPDAQLVPQLETLNFSPNSLDDIANVLMSAPHLQLLGIKASRECFSFDTQATLSTLLTMSKTMLPLLSHIEATMSLAAFNALWSTSPAPPAKYSAELSIRCNDSHINALHGEQLPNTLSNIFHHRNISIDSPSQPTKWSLIVRSLHIQIQVIPSSTTKNTPLDLKFLRGLAPTMDKLLLNCLAPYLSNAMDFTLNMETPRARDSPLKYVGDVLQLMTEVTTITMSESSVRCYNQIESSMGLLFPNLRKVKCISNFYGSEVYKDQFLLFFQKRAKVGRVLPSIYTGNSNNDEMIHDLNRICGPRVRWGLSDKWSKDPELQCRYV